MRKTYSMVIALSLFGCKSNIHEGTDPSELVERIQSAAAISDEEYLELLDGMEYIVNEVCIKAQSILDSGYVKKDVRQRLKLDPIYLHLCQQSSILDSVILEYIYGRGSDYRVRERYKEILSNFSRKAEQLGLNNKMLTDKYSSN